MFYDAYTITLFVFLLFLCVLYALVRRQQKKGKELTHEINELSDVPFQKVDAPSPEDEEAYRIIEQERKRIWKQFSSDADISIETILVLSKDMTAKIAEVYFPDTEEPVYQATVEGLVHLLKRTTERLEGYLNRFPLKILRDRTVRDLMRLHSGYKKVVDNPIAKVIGNKYMSMGRKLLWSAYNVTNPWYYGRQFVWAVGKEAGIRYFLTLVVTIVGEEAVLLFRNSRNVKK